MKVYAVSDMHGSLEGLDPRGIDIVIIAGDFAKMTGFGKWHINDMKKWIQKKFISWTQQYPEAEFVIVPGNHDLIFDPNRIAAFSGIDYSIKWPDNIHVLIDQIIEINGLKIYGTPWVPVISCKWAFEAEHDKLAERFSRIPTGLDILATHSPPRFRELDFSRQTFNGPFGSGELTQAIYEKQPKRVFCGHIHSGDHEPNYIDASTVFNVSRVDEDYEVAYKPTIVEI